MINRSKHFFKGQITKLRNIKEPPERIAGGVAIGMFWGFSPFWGLKTLLSLVTAFLLRCNVVGAVVGVALHEITLPLGPAILWLQYEFGFWLCSNPHRFPHRENQEHFFTHQMLNWENFVQMLNWKNFLEIGRPLLIGAFIFSTVAAVLTYLFVYQVVKRWQRHDTHGHSHKHH